MPIIGDWMTITTNRASDAWSRIQDKPTSITVTRGATELSPQTVRVEWDNTGAEKTGQAGGISSSRKVIVFGVRGHATESNTNLSRDDRFAFNGLIYRVIDVMVTMGEIQARCEVLS